MNSEIALPTNGDEILHGVLIFHHTVKSKQRRRKDLASSLGRRLPLRAISMKKNNIPPHFYGSTRRISRFEAMSRGLY